MKHGLTSSVIVTCLSAAACSAQPGHAGGPPASAQPLDWKALEAPALTHHVQLTSRDQFLKAGEAYFSPEGRWIVFQAVPAPAEGKAPDPHYSMYVAKLTRDSGGHITGMETPILISTPGSWNSCGWFHPLQPYKVLFGSTMEPPSTEQHGEFRVGQRTYTWLFPKETDIVIRSVPAIFKDLNPDAAPVLWGDDAKAPVRVIDRPDYDAEGSYTKDGRFILYSHVREDRQVGQRADADIWVRDTRTGKDYPLVTADGYDGGPFFSPDEKWICYRSDRKGDDLLQLFVAELRYENGIPVGIAREYQVTDNGAVNWAPYWDPTGSFLVYGTSEVGHMNYEVFAVEASPARLRAGTTPADLKRVRLTHANGADVLPVFSPDGRHMMWTAQRGPLGRGDQRPTSQLWVAAFDATGLHLGQ